MSASELRSAAGCWQPGRRADSRTGGAVHPGAGTVRNGVGVENGYRVHRREVEEDANPVRLLEESGALLFGEFTLSSGRKSSYYFDSKKLTMEPAGARFVARRLVDRLDAEGIRYVGGVAYGGIPVVSHIVMMAAMREGAPIRAFYHRKDSKEHGTGANAEGQFPPPASRLR